MQRSCLDCSGAGVPVNYSCPFFICGTTLVVLERKEEEEEDGPHTCFRMLVWVLGSTLFKIATTLLGFLFYLLLSTLLIDLIALVIKMSPLLHGSLSVGLASFVSIYGIWNASYLRVNSVDVEISNIN